MKSVFKTSTRKELHLGFVLTFFGKLAFGYFQAAITLKI